MNHRQAWDLIPWYINGSLTEGQHEPLQQHLAQCAACREEVQAQRTLRQAMHTRPQVESMPHHSLQKLWARIDAQPASPPLAVEQARPSRMVGALAAVVAVQALLLGALVLGLLRMPRVDGAVFRTVAAPSLAPRQPGVRAVFTPGMTLAELQAVLERTHLGIASGPSPEGVYTLAVSDGADPRQALLELRAHPAVRFAEPLGPGTQ